MKLSGLTLIAVAVGSLFAAAPAAAQPQRHVEVHRTVTTTRVTNNGWNDNRRYHRRHHRQKVCTKRWVNHHRVTRCRWR
jgi:hypothetical protein